MTEWQKILAVRRAATLRRRLERAPRVARVAFALVHARAAWALFEQHLREAGADMGFIERVSLALRKQEASTDLLLELEEHVPEGSTTDAGVRAHLAGCAVHEGLKCTRTGLASDALGTAEELIGIAGREVLAEGFVHTGTPEAFDFLAASVPVATEYHRQLAVLDAIEGGEYDLEALLRVRAVLRDE